MPIVSEPVKACRSPTRPQIRRITSPAGAARFTAAEIRAILETGRGRMPPFPHLSAADVDILARYLSAAPGRGGGFGRGGGPVESGAPPELIAGSGSVWTRPEAPGGRGRGAPPPYPEGVPQTELLVINEYGTIGSRMKPPFTTIVKYDLNEPSIKWRIGFGDDPSLVERGITGTGVPQMRNSIIVTESGLVFGAGRDYHIRAWDSESGKQLWSSRFGGNFIGSPAMYEMDGRPLLTRLRSQHSWRPGSRRWSRCGRNDCGAAGRRTGSCTDGLDRIFAAEIAPVPAESRRRHASGSKAFATSYQLRVMS